MVFNKPHETNFKIPFPDLSPYPSHYPIPQRKKAHYRAITDDLSALQSCRIIKTFEDILFHSFLFTFGKQDSWPSLRKQSRSCRVHLSRLYTSIGLCSPLKSFFSICIQLRNEIGDKNTCNSINLCHKMRHSTEFPLDKSRLSNFSTYSTLYCTVSNEPAIV